MSKKKDTSQILSIIKSVSATPLFIEKNHAQSLIMRYESLRKSGAFDGVQNLKENHTQVSFFLENKNVAYGTFSGDFSKTEKGSIAVVTVMGAMMRDSYCSNSAGFVSGTRELEVTIKNLDENDNVDGIVFYINSPGGQADGNESLSKVIASTKTPTVVFFEGMASAAVYAFQGVNELYASETQSYWGSIGTYISIVDDRALWESMGVNFMDIYAPQSTEKNNEFNQALDGNVEPIKDLLSKLTDAFIKTVKKSRPQLQDDGHVFKGKLYNASDALKIGAIDGIKNIEFAIERARTLGKQSKGKNVNTNKNKNTMSIENEKKLSFWEMIFGASSADEVEKDLQKVQNSTKELQEKFDELKKQFNLACQTSSIQVLEIENLNEKLNKSVLNCTEQETKIFNLETSLNAQNESIKSKGFEKLEELIEDYEHVIYHNKELGGVKSAETPINNQQTVDNAPSNYKKSYYEVEAAVISELESKKKKNK